MSVPWATLAIAVLAASAFAFAANSAEPRPSANLEAAFQAHLASLESFPFLRCRYTVTKFEADSVADGLAGRYRAGTAKTSERRWLVDGDLVLHYEEPDPESLKIITEQKPVPVPGRPGLMMVTSTFNRKELLAGGNHSISHNPVMRNINIAPPAMSQFVQRYTPLEVVGSLEFNSLRNLMRDVRDAKATCRVDGNSAIDGRSVFGATFTTHGGYGKAAFLLDIERGYLPHRVTGYAKNVEDERTEMTSVRECSGQRWFPDRVVIIVPRGDAAKTFGVTEVKVVELDVDKRPSRDEFAIDVAAGTWILNTVDGKQGFRTKRAERIHVDDLPNIVAMTERSGAEPRMDTAIVSTRGVAWTFWAGIGGLVALLGATAYGVIRRRRVSR